ncbi:HDIG domain-containing protein [Clostridium sp. PL3]|uniref:HDIG domain-containing protein n=1 Tax=Clostridium thailandense TaxID=2794346 RepID=A0A949WRZ8_9CLOT|nr:HDIG domain-containing metalloprotein [Clostridium thailandense]MBV7274536.1 HDIG domain-containing protein [Clostridium thailandense]
MNDLSRIFKEIDKHLMDDDKPSLYINGLINTEMFLNLYPFTLLRELKETPQSPIYHPEGDVWNHTMLVLDEAAKRKKQSEDSRAFMWAALLHDIGKPSTTRYKKGKITSYDHDKVGKEITVKFLKEFKCESEFIKKVASLVRWHMHTLFIVKDLPFADIESMLSEVNANEIALFSMCDRLGRGNITREKVLEVERNMKYFISQCNLKAKKLEFAGT